MLRRPLGRSPPANCNITLANSNALARFVAVDGVTSSLIDKSEPVEIWNVTNDDTYLVYFTRDGDLISCPSIGMAYDVAARRWAADVNRWSVSSN